MAHNILLSCSKISKTLTNLQGIGVLQIKSDSNLDSSIRNYNITNYPKIMDKSIALSKSTTSLEIISPFLYNMSITELHLLKNGLHLFHKKDNMLKNGLHLFHKKDNMLRSTFESHVFLLTKYANIQKIIPSILNSSAHKIYKGFSSRNIKISYLYMNAPLNFLINCQC